MKRLLKWNALLLATWLLGVNLFDHFAPGKAAPWPAILSLAGMFIVANMLGIAEGEEDERLR